MRHGLEQRRFGIDVGYGLLLRHRIAELEGEPLAEGWLHAGSCFSIGFRAVARRPLPAPQPFSARGPRSSAGASFGYPWRTSRFPRQNLEITAICLGHGKLVAPLFIVIATNIRCPRPASET